ncbi:MAG: methionyl-tRNA formyltransferase [Betaproteobacteria bacterium]|nr:methionyl-tRNA formyltransferase [Betaproteobacteria bacterium]
MAAATAVVFGYGDIGVRGLAALLEAGLEVPLVVTHKDDPNETRWYASLFDFSTQKGLRVLTDPPMDIGTPDLIFSFYYRNMLPMSLLTRARLGAYNMHGSLLPKFRGRAPLNWAIVEGETETGATLHEMVEKPDAGRIVDQQAVPIGPDETAVEVFRKLADAADAVLRRSIKDLASGKAKLRPNDLSKGSYFGRRRPEDGRIDWSRSAQEIHNLVRAVAPPFPGAFTDGMKIHKTRIEPGRKALKKGPFQEGGEWFAGCGDGKVLRLLEVQESK